MKKKSKDKKGKGVEFTFPVARPLNYEGKWPIVLDDEAEALGKKIEENIDKKIGWHHYADHLDEYIRKNGPLGIQWYNEPEHKKPPMSVKFSKSLASTVFERISRPLAYLTLGKVREGYHFYIDRLEESPEQEMPFSIKFTHLGVISRKRTDEKKWLPTEDSDINVRLKFDRNENAIIVEPVQVINRDRIMDWLRNEHRRDPDVMNELGRFYRMEFDEAMDRALPQILARIYRIHDGKIEI